MPRRQLVSETWINSPDRRALDVSYATALAPLIVPLGALTMGASKLIDGEGQIYTHQRSGKLGRPFDVYKIQTAFGNLGSTTTGNNDKATALSRYITEAGLDETPQILNILEGTMSIWGPRAATPQFYEAVEAEAPGPVYREWIEKRWLSKPGAISSYALAFHLGELPVAQRRLKMIEMDNRDFDNASLVYDHKLLMRAFKSSAKLFRRR